MRAASVRVMFVKPATATFSLSTTFFFSRIILHDLLTSKTSALRRGGMSRKATGSLILWRRSLSSENLPCEGNCFKLILPGCQSPGTTVDSLFNDEKKKSSLFPAIPAEMHF